MGDQRLLTLFFRQNVSPALIKTDWMETRPDTPRPTMEAIINLRTPSILYNHGGYYAPGDPKTCSMPGGPCSNCQARIDEEEAAEALVLLSKAPSCCSDRPAFLEPCPQCNATGSFVTHESQGKTPCNGCPNPMCIKCFFGARYYCPLRKDSLTAPADPLERQLTLGVQSPRAEEKTDNK
jgi:hypothetical protein